jgi:hypothetical protein
LIAENASQLLSELVVSSARRRLIVTVLPAASISRGAGMALATTLEWTMMGR